MEVSTSSCQTVWSCKQRYTDSSIRIRAAAIVQIGKKDTRGVHARDFPLSPIIKTRSEGSNPPPLQHGRMKKGAKIAFPQLYIAVAQCGAFFNSVASYPLGNRLIHLAALCLVPVLQTASDRGNT